MSDTRVRVTEVRSIEHFTYRWPDGIESFEGGWEYRAEIDGKQFRLRHGIESRVVYGRERVHTVTWFKGQPAVEGVEADDYPVSEALLSGLRRPDRKHVRRLEEVPAGYESFDVVEPTGRSRRPTARTPWQSRLGRTTSVDGHCTPGYAVAAP